MDSSVEILPSGRPLDIPLSGSVEDRDHSIYVQATDLLRRMHADVLIWGDAAESNKYVDLHFIALNHDVQDITYPLNQYLYLPIDFARKFDAVIAGIATSLAAPAEARSRYQVALLEHVRPRLATLLRRPPTSATNYILSEIWRAYGLVTFALADETGDRDAFRDAITAFRHEVSLLNEEKDPLVWGAAQNHLSESLVNFGFREKNDVLERDAIDADHLALRALNRTKWPLQWASVMINLGYATERLGDRRRGTELYSAAISMLQSALPVATKRNAPLLWAQANNDLGIAYMRIGERKQDKGASKIAVIAYQHGIAAFHRALQILNRSSTPLLWAGANNNLAGGLAELGDAQNNIVTVQRATAAFQNALQVYTKDHNPSDWAMTEHNLGDTYEFVAEHKKDRRSAERAIACFRRALTVRRRDVQPYEWAQTADDMGSALEIIGISTHNVAALRSALTWHSEAMSEFSRANSDADRDYAAENITRTKKRIRDVSGTSSP